MDDEETWEMLAKYVEQLEIKKLKEENKIKEDNIVINLLKDGFSVDYVKKITNLSQARIMALANSIVLK